MPKTRIEDRWLTVVKDYDIFIHKVEVKITPKMLTIIRQENGQGKNTALGFDGNREDVSYLVGYRTQLTHGDPRFCRTYEEALERVQKLIDEKAASAARILTRVNNLQRLKDGVTYVKHDQPLTPVDARADG